MTVQQANIDGIELETENVQNASGTLQFCLALVSFEMPIYATATDSGKIGGGGNDRGASTTDTLATIIQKQRRDGKTVTLKSAMLAQPGRQGSTFFYTGALTVSAGNLTFSITQTDEATGIDAPAGVHDNPIQVWVRYALS